MIIFLNKVKMKEYAPLRGEKYNILALTEKPMPTDTLSENA